MRWFWKKKKPEIISTTHPKVLVCESILQISVMLLQEAKDEHSAHEGILYWAGKSFDNHWWITTCIAPQTISTWGSYKTSARSNADVIQLLAKHKLEIFSQLHSHPGTNVNHSEGDDKGALMPYENFLSIVVPSYAEFGILPLERCGVHRFQNNRFVRLSETEINSTLTIVPSTFNLRK